MATGGTAASGINDAGQIVGYLLQWHRHHGFLYSGGTYTTLDDPLATGGTTASGINDAGQIVGTYFNGTGSHGFLYSGGIYTTLDDPLAHRWDRCAGINDAGQVVGSGTGYTASFTAAATTPRSTSLGLDRERPHPGSMMPARSSVLTLMAPTHGYLLIASANRVERFFDSATGDHFYTLSPAEANQIRATLPTYHDEGAPWGTPDKGTNTIDVFRFFDVATGAHFLTTSTAERDHVMATLPSYHYEGVAFEAYSAPGDGTLTLERFFNTQTHLHHYAASAAETASILNGGAGPGWVDEGAGFIVHA